MDKITVHGFVKRVDNKFDRKVFAIPETQKAAARSVLDILRTLPGVVVDESGNIRYKGAEATVQIDEQNIKHVFGKIEMVPVERIDKIELIDAAMRTGGDGRGGIINIKLKQIRDDGFSGMISALLNTVKFKDINDSREFGNLNYKNSKFTFFVNSTFETDKHSRQTVSESNFNLLDLPYFQTSNENTFWKTRINSNYAGGFYNPTRNTQFYISMAYLTLKYTEDNFRNFSELNSVDDSKITGYTGESSLNEKQLWTGGYLSFRHNTDTLDSYIKLSAYFYFQKIPRNENYQYFYETLNSRTSDSIYMYANNRNSNSKYMFFNAFYNHSISEKSRWNISYSLSFDWTNPSIFHQYVFDELNLPLTQKNKNFQQSHNLSFRFGSEWKKWKFDAGLNLMSEFNTGQYLRYNMNDSDTTLFINKKHFRLLPSATIAYLLNKATEIKLSLAKTATFPHFLDLLDYVDKNNVFQWKSGNSNLKPVDFYSAYLAYNYDVDKWNASAELFYNFTNNDIKNMSAPVNSLIFLIKPENIAKTSNVGIDFSIWYKIIDKLNFTLSASIYHTNFDLNSLIETAKQQNLMLPELTRKQYGCDIKYSMEYTLPKDIYTTFYINYHSKEVTYNGYKKPYIGSAIHISKKLFDNKLRVTLSLNNIFGNYVNRGSYSNNFGIISNILYNGTPYKYTYGISLQYDFNKGDRGTGDLK
ncbi:MAG: TonB-dependent receptor [Prevotellaceae bacterium]|nr:TonB-dependent receptor [Prevotellaceae bacterium]